MNSHSTPHQENNYNNSEKGDYFENSADEWVYTLLKESSIRFQDDCDTCKWWREHAIQAKTMRTEYQKDKEKINEDGKMFFTRDLEKVIMLPRLPVLKKSIFTKRIFYSMSSKGLQDTVLWHEGIKGRNEDICSALCKLLYHPKCKECIDFVIQFDNCCAQSKNESLYSGMIVKSTRILITSIRSSSNVLRRAHIHGGKLLPCRS